MGLKAFQSDVNIMFTTLGTNTYSKTQTDTKLFEKANVVDVYTKAQTAESFAPKEAPILTGTVQLNYLSSLEPNPFIVMESGLKVGFWGLSVDTISSNTSLPSSVQFISPVVIGHDFSNKSLTVNGSLLAEKNLSVKQSLLVDTISPNVAPEITIAGDLAVGEVLLVDTITTSNGSEISIEDNVRITGSLHLGSTNVLNSLNPYWVSVVIIFTGTVPSFLRANGGRNTATALTRNSLGNIYFEFPAHPQGANYVINCCGLNCNVTINNKTSTRAGFIIRDVSSFTPVDREIHVCISAY